MEIGGKEMLLVVRIKINSGKEGGKERVITTRAISGLDGFCHNRFVW